MRLAQIIDDEGRVWPLNSLELRRNLLCMNYPGDLTGDLVRQMGFVKLEHSRAQCTLSYSRRLAAPAALLTAIRELHDARATAVRTHFVDDGSAVTHLDPNLACATLRLVALLDARNSAGRLRAEPVAWTERRYGDRFQELFNHWKIKGTKTFGGELAEVAHRIGLSRNYLAHQNADGDFILDAFGSGLQVPDERQLRATIGAPITQLPDKLYWSWVAKAYADAVVSTGPTIHAVNADIYWPKYGWAKRSYERVLLPCTHENQSRALFGISLNRTLDSGLAQAS